MLVVYQQTYLKFYSELGLFLFRAASLMFVAVRNRLLAVCCAIGLAVLITLFCPTFSFVSIVCCAPVGCWAEITLRWSSQMNRSGTNMSPHNCVATFLEYLRRSAVEQALKTLSAVLVNFKVPTDRTFARFGIVLALLVKTHILLDIMPCRLMSTYGRFGGCASYLFTSRLCTCKCSPERSRLVTYLRSFGDYGSLSVKELNAGIGS